MRILIDLQSCQSGSRLGGIGRYSMNLVQGMLRNSASHDIHILLNTLMEEGKYEIYEALEGLIKKDNIHFFKAVGPVMESFPGNEFRARSSELLRELSIIKLNPDIIFVTSLFEGLGDDVVVSVSRLTKDIPTAVILYDLIPLVESEKYLADSISKSHYYRKLDDLGRADILLSISEYSKHEAVCELDFSPEKIKNISSAVDNKFRKIDVDIEFEKLLQVKYGFSKKFMMYTGSFDQRKNHEYLIKAFAMLPYELRHTYQLLIVGNGWEGIYNHLKDVGLKAGLSEHDLVFLGKVEDEELLALYNMCSLFVFPSLREGFGLPVLEAMSCGVPVIGSNTTSIPEVIGNEKALFDPADVNSISLKMLEVLTSDSLRLELVEEGLKQAEKFSWDISARKVILAFEDFFEKVGKKDSVSSVVCDDLLNLIGALPSARESTKEDIMSIAVSVSEICADEITRMTEYKESPFSKIGLITTWNTKCGIAMYSKYLISSELDEYLVFAPFAQSATSADEYNVRRCWEVGGGDLDVLYESIISDNVWVVLIQFNYGFFDFYIFRDFVERLFSSGRKVSITLHSTTDPDSAIYLNKKLSCLSGAFSRCENIIVHSINDVGRLRKIGLVENVTLMPQGVYASSGDSLGFKFRSAGFVVASYGFFLPHKGFIELIDAVYKLNEMGVDVSLLMLNAAYDSSVSYDLISLARENIRNLGLEDKISIVSDFLSDELSIGLLRNSDLVVFPYQETGESSSAAVRMGLASGVPVAVTPLQIFDDVRDVVFRLPGTSSFDIAEGIKVIMDQVLRNSEEVDEILSRAEKWKEKRYYSALGRRLRGNLLGGEQSFLLDD